MDEPNPDQTAPPRDQQRVEITKHIRVLWGADVDTDGGPWTGWAVWDDYQEECPVYPTKDQAIQAAKRLAKEYADNER